MVSWSSSSCRFGCWSWWWRCGLAGACLVVIATASPGTLDDCPVCEQDRVHALPGYNAPLPCKTYSGFLHYELFGRHVSTHYVLMEAEDVVERDGATASSPRKPLIYWSNGGPGASSLFGLLTELGPFLLNDLSLKQRQQPSERTGANDAKDTSSKATISSEDKIPTPLYNPFAWTRLGHVLIFDQPAPVGFSYCNNETDSHSCDGLVWTDAKTAENAYAAMQAFYNKHTRFRNKELYLTGESYAGIYIPTLARAILENGDASSRRATSAAADDEWSIAKQMRGIAVGDGCLGTETGICGDLSGGGVDLWPIWFLAGHGQIPLATLNEALEACQASGADEVAIGSAASAKPSADCTAVLDKARSQAGGYYGYSLYDDCTYRNGLARSSRQAQGALNDYPCGQGPVMEQYVREPSVKQALNVEHASFFSVDNAEGDFQYTPTEKDLTTFYKRIHGKLKVLIYNGDTDPAITSFAAQNWTSSLGFEETESWRPWTVDGCRRMGGYVTRYGGKFDFLTIRGAGHMVPTYKAEASFAFMQAWLYDEEYPAFDKDCQFPDGARTTPDIVTE